MPLEYGRGRILLHCLGYAAISLSIDATTNRTCRLRNATSERLRELIRLNLQDLYRILLFNVQHGIFFYRISSQIIPFASHPVNNIPWWNECAGQFDQLAEIIRHHKLRVSMHPGQFTLLNSPDSKILTASLLDLRWHVQFMECLQTDASNKIVIHVGGAYGNKKLAADRFVSATNALPRNWRSRLVVENDERSYTVEDVLDICRRTGLPAVFDWLHDRINPGLVETTPGLIGRCFDTWDVSDGLPKVHFSSAAESGRHGQHGEWACVDEFERFLKLVSGRDFDCMVEAKRKDLAVFRLRQELADRGIIEKAIGGLA